MKKSKQYHLVRIVGIVLAAIFLFSAVKLAGSIMEKNAQERMAEDRATAPTSESWGSRVEYNDTKYHRRNDVSSVLFLGIDYGITVQKEGNMGTGGRSDTIMLFILDDRTSTIQTLLIPRETMVNVDLYKANGDYAFSGPAQITLQYAYGDSPKRSCYLSKRKVSELLYGTRIDACVSLSAEGIGQIIDSIGGISVTLSEDYEDDEVSYPKGTVVELTGENAEHFVRYRELEHGQNMVRMNRHYDILEGLLAKLKGSKTEDLVEKMSDAADRYVESDLDADTLKKLTTYRMEDEYILLPGELTQGESFDEYYADEEALKALLLELFYEER